MCLIFFGVTILILFVRQTTAEQRCDNSLCNHESVCILENDKPICSCVGKVFEGEFCTKLIDHCISNPCKNGGTCHTYPGHYYCECAPDYSGQKCTSKQDVFKGFHLHYNRIVPIGKKQLLLLMVQSHGTVESLIEFFTPDYIIDGVAFTASSGHFKPSNNLKTLSKQLGIKHSDGLPYNSGFYRISDATFWKLGVHTMSIDTIDFGETSEIFFTGLFDIYVFDPSQTQCLPVVRLPHCSNPRQALHMDYVTFNFLEPIVDKRCAEHLRLRIRWSVRNYIDTVVLYKFPMDASSVLTIPPYQMWFNYQDDYVQSYLILGDVKELDSSGKVVSETVLRCYVFVDSKPITANILGGDYREINAGKGFTVDGSISRDYARRPNSDQKLEYRWSCVSEDTQNPYCLKNMGSKSRLKIPPGSLKLDQTYKFTLRIRSTINVYITDRSSQQIKVVSEDPLLIHFYCLRNCEQNKFAAGTIIHLKIGCIGCPPGHVAYSVRNKEGTEIANSHSVVITENTKKEVYLKAEATLGSQKGTTSIKLTLNNPPAKGKCKISPTSGTEYQTIFEISCPGYEDDEAPIDYKYRAGNITLDHSGNDTLSTRLFPTSGQNCEIKISICDDIGACAEVELKVVLNAIDPGGSWLDFLSQNESNLKQLIEDEDRSTAIVLIQTAIQHMPASENFEIAEYIVQSLRNLKLIRLLAVEQVLTVTSDLFEATDLSNDLAIIISELFWKVANGLLHTIRNEEVIELPLETHEQMIDNVAQSMTKASSEIEEFPMVHDAESIPLEDPFLENYSDYGELDMEDVVHISNWLQAFNSMHKCLQVMGVVSAFIQLPDETAVIIKRKGIISWTLVIDKSESESLSWNESTTFVSLPDDFLRSLTGKEIAIQVSIFEKNPFWWNPEQYKMNAKVISVGAYTKDLTSLESTSTKLPFSFFMTLNSHTEIDEGNAINGSVENALDMPTYEKLLPAHGILVVTFMPLDEDIRILLMINKKPRSYMLEKAKKVKASQEKSTFVLVNPCCKEIKAFLAVTSQSSTRFSFVMYVRLCLNWNPSTYEWSSEHCSVGNQTNATHIQCLCCHLSMFGAKVHPTFGHLQSARDIVQNLAPNYNMMVFYLIIIILLCLLLCLAWRRDMTVAEGLIVLNSKPGRRGTHKHKYVVTIYTNGHANAATTANVTIQLHGSLSNSAQYTLYSNSYHSLFQRNSQASFAILSATSLGVLESVSLYHDSFGRYPTWNCYTIKVRDKTKRKDYIFLVNKWLSDYESTTCSTFTPLAKKEDLQRRRLIFRDTLTDAFANWYAQQAVCSIKLCGNLTAIEKATIFIVRVCTILVGTIVVFGSTTKFNYEDERETYYSMLLEMGKLLFIAFCCHLVGFLEAVGLEYLFLIHR